MKKDERENWIINIENTADVICAQLGFVVADAVLARYGARSIYDLSPSDYSEVFSELYAIEADLK